ncbi:MAG TPA: hypothetical protein VJH89_04280 [Patescibacteria group bacterium]|nr:hypothetical protein [Patescibacteria group bacterium]
MPKGLFSGFLFLSFGLTSVTSVVSDIETQRVSEPTIIYTNEARQDMNAFERCYWQEDFALFVMLREQKVASDVTEEVCKKIIADAIMTKKLAVTNTNSALRQTIQEMTAEYPIVAMAPAIAEYDREIAGLLVGIAKKESNWGKRVPLDEDGKDCFNYWGYKGAGTRGVAMGHGCFGSPEEAVSVVGDRLKKLVTLRNTSEPKNMIVWKCGSSCKGHSDESVRKWIADVSLYYQRITQQ